MVGMVTQSGAGDLGRWRCGIIALTTDEFIEDPILKLEVDLTEHSLRLLSSHSPALSSRSGVMTPYLEYEAE